MEITGEIIQIMPIQSGVSKDGKEWQKQDIIIKTDGQYPKNVAVTLFGGKVNDTYNVGDTGTFSIHVESREYNGKWVTNVQAWKYDIKKSEPTFNAPNLGVDVAPNNNYPTDDLPF